jgi:hypothetical protein
LLADVEDMTIAAVAHDYWLRAIMFCLEDKPAYFRFLASNFAETNSVKHALQLLSVEHLQRRLDFEVEAIAFLAS